MSKKDKAVDSVKESKKEKRERKKEKKEKKEVAEKTAGKDPKLSEDEESSDEVSDTKKKELEELEIDLAAGVPLSKKQQRALKKGKLDLEKLSKKNPAPRPILTAEEEAEEAAKTKKSPFGVWVGNLSFDTSKEDITRFIMAKTALFVAFKDSEKDDDLVAVENIDMTRVNVPKKDNKIKGFAYVDLPSIKHVNAVVSLSESQLNGRKLLIKNSTSFEGRPKPQSDQEKAISKNPPSRILFVGNLSFDTTQDNLEEHFRHCGEIVKIRMATFQDTGKCKGFAFVDFKDEAGATTALKSKLARELINRPLRMEYGEDRSKRTPNQKKREQIDAYRAANGQSEYVGPDEAESAPVARERPVVARERTAAPPKKRTFRDDSNANKRVKSSVALATAQRASQAIVPSAGKKTTFD